MNERDSTYGIRIELSLHYETAFLPIDVAQDILARACTVHACRVELSWTSVHEK